jgi:hypothetical protein
MRRLHLATVILSMAVLAACGDSSQPLAAVTPPPTARADAAFTNQINEFIPVEFDPTFASAFSPCGNGGAGEFILFTGTIHFVSHITQTGNGTFLVTQHQIPQGLAGTGAITGDKYLGLGNSTFHLTISPGLTTTTRNRLRFIGPGPDNTLLLSYMNHLTINADGEITSERTTALIEECT